MAKHFLKGGVDGGSLRNEDSRAGDFISPTLSVDLGDVKLGVAI